MKTRYYLEKSTPMLVFIFAPLVFTASIGLVGIGTYWQIALGLFLGLVIELGTWCGFALGTYITIDENAGSLQKTGLFIDWKPILLSAVVSLSVRHFAVDMGSPSVWITYQKSNGK